MTFTSAGKKKSAAYGLLMLLDSIVMALATRVNIFQEFFFMADIFPLVLSSVTLFLLAFTFVLDVVFKRTWLTIPVFEIGLLYTMSIFWLAFNAFSTMRWSLIPLNCASVPFEYGEWCRDVQALKSFVWILFIAIFFTASFNLRYAYIQHRKGNRHVWSTPLSRFRPQVRLNPGSVSPLDRQTITDYFVYFQLVLEFSKQSELLYGGASLAGTRRE
ncbi:hypothetical protein EUX98_g1835 [Antrodiella citrinella]|uniref:MARVEL domain-containing protein n=1 Tax=Antrodiella citrinella TaxID=2447956 RepID=A0A4S4N3E1_9APHY|nr:hypothetical protein EUX98_g1835 [Antrodiella citrinella]